MAKNRAMASKRTTGATANAIMNLQVRVSRCNAANCENEVIAVKTLGLDGKTKKFCLEHLTNNQDSAIVESVMNGVPIFGTVLDIKNYFKGF